MSASAPVLPYTGKEFLASLDGSTVPDLVNPDDVSVLPRRSG